MRVRFILPLVVVISSATVFAQEVPPRVVIVAPRAASLAVGEGAFTGEIREGNVVIAHLRPNEYQTIWLSFVARHVLDAVPADGGIAAGKFAADDFSYGQIRFFRVRIVSGRAVLEELSVPYDFCALRGVKRVGERDVDVDGTFSGYGCKDESRKH